jgi:uncharacterized protein YceK
MTAGPRTLRAPKLFAISALIAALALAGCGSSSTKKVSAESYVRSVCTSTASWYHSVQGAAASLQTKVHSSPSISSVKTAYVSFIDTLLHATSRTEQQLRAAGAPDVKNGKGVATEVVRAFDRARRGLESAASLVRKAPTSSSSAFQTAAGGVQATIQRSLASMSSLAPQKNPQLHAAAQKEPSCQQLRALG